MAPNARRYCESTEIRKEMFQVSPEESKRFLDICVEQCARSGKFVKSFGLRDREEVCAHYLKIEVKRLGRRRIGWRVGLRRRRIFYESTDHRDG